MRSVDEAIVGRDLHEWGDGDAGGPMMDGAETRRECGKTDPTGSHAPFSVVGRGPAAVRHHAPRVREQPNRPGGPSSSQWSRGHQTASRGPTSLLLYDSKGEGETSGASARTRARLAGRGAGGGVGLASGRARSQTRGHWGCWGRAHVMWHLGASMWHRGASGEVSRNKFCVWHPQCASHQIEARMSDDRMARTQ